jgi:hypothetical protein
MMLGSVCAGDERLSWPLKEQKKSACFREKRTSPSTREHCCDLTHASETPQAVLALGMHKAQHDVLACTAIQVLITMTSSVTPVSCSIVSTAWNNLAELLSWLPRR